jgi:hypothetical protein
VIRKSNKLARKCYFSLGKNYSGVSAVARNKPWHAYNRRHTYKRKRLD